MIQQHEFMKSSACLIHRLLCCCFFAYAGLAKADGLEYFGLHHSSLGNASIGIDNNLEVGQIGESGGDGITTELGDADSAIFFYPNTSFVEQGYTMRADIYGSFNGRRNSFIGRLYGYRADYGSFYAGVDFSAIGATNVTFQLWDGTALMAETTQTSGEVFMYAEYSQPPRVNPWWRRPNGDHGAWIEFSYPLAVTLPGGAPIYGDRIFMRPNGATGTVDYISRSDVFGAGGLANFRFDGMRLGVFGRAHLSLSGCKMIARSGSLEIAEIPFGEDGGGVLVELHDPSAHAQVDLMPLEIAVPNTNEFYQQQVIVYATGTRSNYSTYVGSIQLLNSNGALSLFSYPTEFDDGVAEVFSNNVFIGDSPFAFGRPINLAGAPRLVAVEVVSDQPDDGPAGFAMRFDTNTIFTISNTQFAGNRILVRSARAFGFADVTAVTLTAREVPSFTIVGESSVSTLPALEIVRSGANVILKWRDPAQAFRVEAKASAEEFFQNIPVSLVYSNGVTTAVVDSSSDKQFFRLHRITYSY